MEIIKDNHSTHYLNQTKSQKPTNTIRKSPNKLKATDYFDYIYSSPKKIKIKWDGLDELNEDVFVASKSNTGSRTLINDSFLNEVPAAARTKNYSIANYFDGFLNKINSSNFFIQKTKQIQSSLSTVPVFVIINGNNEVILNKPSNVLGSRTLTNFVSEKVYDSCGAFDSSSEKKLELGLFFMNFSNFRLNLAFSLPQGVVKEKKVIFACRKTKCRKIRKTSQISPKL